jgi:hypothetical protein
LGRGPAALLAACNGIRVIAPRGLRPAEIRKALHDKGVEISFTSLRHALDQLAKRNAAEQVSDSKTWRYSGGTP